MFPGCTYSMYLLGMLYDLTGNVEYNMVASKTGYFYILGIKDINNISLFRRTIYSMQLRQILYDFAGSGTSDMASLKP